MVPMPVALLFIACLALLLILVVNQCLVDDVALLLVNSPAPLLAAGVKHSAASGLGELVAMLLVTNVLQWKIVSVFWPPLGNLLA